MRSAALVALVAVVAAGCPGSKGPQQVGSQPSWRTGGAKGGTAIAPVTFAPTAEPAQRYNEPLQLPPKSPLGDAVIAMVKDAAGRAGTNVPFADARLFRACAELAAVVPQEGVITYAAVE